MNFVSFVRFKIIRVVDVGFGMVVMVMVLFRVVVVIFFSVEFSSMMLLNDRVFCLGVRVWNDRCVIMLLFVVLGLGLVRVLVVNDIVLSRLLMLLGRKDVVLLFVDRRLFLSIVLVCIRVGLKVMLNC